MNISKQVIKFVEENISASEQAFLNVIVSEQSLVENYRLTDSLINLNPLIEEIFFINDKRWHVRLLDFRYYLEFGFNRNNFETFLYREVQFYIDSDVRINGLGYYFRNKTIIEYFAV